MKVFVSVILLALAGFAQAPAPPASPATPATPREDGLYATLETSMGTIIAKLYEKESPITVKNFIDLSLGLKSWPNPKTGQRTRKPLYPGTTFHRVIPKFMIQGGSPDAAKDAGSDPIKDEFNNGLLYDKPGRFGMANIGEPNTGSSQFFITEVPTPHLNNKHTIFAQVVEGQEVVGQIARVPVQGSKPVTPVILKKITFERVGPGPVPGRPVPAAKPKPTGTTTKKAPATSSSTPKAPVKK